MKISIISVIPELHEAFISKGIIGKAVEKGLIEFNLIKLSDLVPTKVRIDEPICGPGVGMIVKPEVMEKAITSCEKKYGEGFTIFFSPQGIKLNQHMLKKLAQTVGVSTNRHKDNQQHISNIPNSKKHIILVCSRYEGTDERVEKHYADMIISIGDFVLMGGDIPAQVLLESLLRLMPGVVGKQQSVEEDSFSHSFLDHPHYGRPIEWKDYNVPEILLSGNHAQIKQWRNETAAKKTILNRFDWFNTSQPNKDEITLAKKFIPNHYVALLHSQVMIKNKGAGHTSIASLDIHDIARSSRTYGVTNYFIVSQLKDQQNIMNTFLEFWRSEEGKKYNKSRFEAVSRVKPAYYLQEVIDDITKQEGVAPLIIATSAKPHKKTSIIDYFHQSQVWKRQKPILFLFGTGQGLADEVLDQSDYLLLPIEGMTDFNHLSVRSAVGIILDRWLGLHHVSHNQQDKIT